MQTVISTYGKGYTVKCQIYEDICERETETVEETTKETEIEAASL